MFKQLYGAISNNYTSLTNITITKNSTCLRPGISVMVLTGVWLPDSCSDFPKKQLYYVYSLLFQSAAFHLIVAAEIAYLFTVIGDTEKTVDATVLLLSHLVQEIKMMTLLVRRERIKRLIMKIDAADFASPSDPTQPELWHTVKLVTVVSYMMIITAATTAVFWGLVPIIKTDVTLPLKTSYPFDITHIFVLMYMYLSLSLVLVAMCDASVNYLVAALLILASGQVDVLSGRLRAVGGRRAAYDVVVDCVKHHQKIFEFVNELSSIFRMPIFFQIVISSIVICMTVYKISVTNEPVELITMIFYLICVLLELTMYCYSGDLLMNKGLSVSEAAYSGDWVNCDLRTRKLILVIMMRSQRPMVINAGGVYKLCLPTAASVVQASYSYYAMLKQTAK